MCIFPFPTRRAVFLAAPRRPPTEPPLSLKVSLALIERALPTMEQKKIMLVDGDGSALSAGGTLTVLPSPKNGACGVCVRRTKLSCPAVR
jgi:hypothetical protein